MVNDPFQRSGCRGRPARDTLPPNQNRRTRGRHANPSDHRASLRPARVGAARAAPGAGRKRRRRAVRRRAAPPALAPEAAAFRDGLGARARRPARGPADRDRRLLSPRATMRRSGPSRAARGPPSSWRRSPPPATRRCRPAATTPRACGSRPRRPGRRTRSALMRAYLAYAGDLSAGVLDPSSVDRRDHPQAGAAVGGGAARAARDRAGRRGAGGASSRPTRLSPAGRREAPAGGAGADRELGAGGAGRPDAAPGRQRAAGRRAARPAGPPRLPRPRAARPSTRGSTPASRRRCKAFQARLRPDRRRRRRRDDARGGQRAGRDAAGAGGGQPRAACAGCRATSATRYLYVNIPDFTVKLVEGGAPVWESRVVVGKAQVTETAGVLRRDDLHGRQPDLAHPRLDRDPRLPAEAAEATRWC